MSKLIFILLPIVFYILCTISCEASNLVHIKGSSNPGDSLFSIVYQERWGFINQKGDIVIAPKFRNVGDFSEGLCPVRLHGRYGFINTKGEFVIPAIYDYALSFSEGLARVYVNGKVLFIDKEGKSPWSIDVKDVSDYKLGEAKVTFQSGDSIWTGVLNKAGVIRIPELSKSWTISEGKIIATQEFINEKGYPSTEYAVIDSTSGQTIVSFGTYRVIKPYIHGFANVRLHDNDPNDYIHGFINRTGELTLTLPKGSFPVADYFSEGLIAIKSPRIPREDCHTFGKYYITWYDTLGEIVRIDKEIQDALPYQNGRTFVRKLREWVLVDTSGKLLSNNHFVSFRKTDLSQNLVLVASYPTSKAEENEHAKNNAKPLDPMEVYFQSSPKEKWGAIDSMGEYVIQPQFDKIHALGFQQEGLLVAIIDAFPRKENVDPFTGKSYHWGLIDRKGNYHFKPKFSKVSEFGFKNGLLYAEIDSLYGYVDNTGNFVWSAIRIPTAPVPQPLNSAFMLPGKLRRFHADDNLEMDRRNHHSHTSLTDKFIPKDTFGIFVDSIHVDTFQQKWLGKRVLVFNTSNDTLHIDAQDGRLNIVMQAIDPNSGEWRDIEFFTDSWCGNSYYTIPMGANEYWHLIIPVYEGEIFTELRLAFTWQSQWHGNDPAFTKTMYSNTFSGSINPGQFWNHSRSREIE